MLGKEHLLLVERESKGWCEESVLVFLQSQVGFRKGCGRKWIWEAVMLHLAIGHWGLFWLSISPIPTFFCCLMNYARHEYTIVYTQIYYITLPATEPIMT